MQDPLAADDVAASVRAWMAAWGAEVASVDMAAARHRFAPHVVGFGTFARMVHGLDALEADQWRNIWPSISGFAFRLDELVVIASADGRQAVAVVPWDSEGREADGDSYARPGRATVVLQRESAQAPWLGVHTHFSLSPGAPIITRSTDASE
jgi:ketosteroid isomerase-like protein